MQHGCVGVRLLDLGVLWIRAQLTTMQWCVGGGEGGKLWISPVKASHGQLGWARTVGWAGPVPCISLDGGSGGRSTQDAREALSAET